MSNKKRTNGKLSTSTDSASTEPRKRTRPSDDRNLLSNFDVGPVTVGTSADNGQTWRSILPLKTDVKTNGVGRYYTVRMPKTNVLYRVEGSITSPVPSTFQIHLSLGRTCVTGTYATVTSADGSASFVFDRYIYGDDAGCPLDWKQIDVGTAAADVDPDMNVLRLSIVPCEYRDRDDSYDADQTKTNDLAIDVKTVPKSATATTIQKIPVVAKPVATATSIVRAIKRQPAGSSVTGDVSFVRTTPAEPQSLTADMYQPAAYRRSAAASASAAAASESCDTSDFSSCTSDLSGFAAAVVVGPSAKVGVAGPGPKPAGCTKLPSVGTSKYYVVAGVHPKQISIALLQAD